MKCFEDLKGKLGLELGLFWVSWVVSGLLGLDPYTGGSINQSYHAYMLLHGFLSGPSGRRCNDRSKAEFSSTPG
jgi:hypothetical protein